MAYNSLQQYVEIMEEKGELIRIKEFVDYELEITEITDRVSKQPGGGKALLFENTGTDFPVLINALGSYSRICSVFAVENLDEIGDEIALLFKELSQPHNSLIDKLRLLPTLKHISSWMPKTVSGKGECQHIINKQPDISKFPVLKCWPYDGGRFITLPLVNTKSLVTNVRNVGMYRMQLLDENQTAMHWHRHKGGAQHFREYEKAGKKMPVAVALGGDPVYTYAATAPMPENIDEYLLAGFLRKKRVELVKCITQDIEVPADCDIVIEGYIDPQEEPVWEGPFGDHTGFYSLPDRYPRFHITCITHRENAIYPATVVGVPPQEDTYISKATERIFLSPIKLAILPELIDMNMPEAGVAHNLAIVSMKKTYPGQALKVMNALWGAGQMMFNKMLIVVDSNVNVHDYKKLARIVSERIIPGEDIYFSQGPLDELDHAATKATFGGKMGIDATTKLEEELLTENPAIQNSTEMKMKDKENIIFNNTAIVAINDEWLAKGISVIFIAIKKDKTNTISNIFATLYDSNTLENIKFVIFLDSFIDIYDLKTTAWIFAGNIDPKRDSILKYKNGTSGKLETSVIAFDGTRKSKTGDGFKRDWPNIVASDKETIHKIDDKWSKLKIEKFIPSPSLRLLKYIQSDGASVAEEQ